ncbi:MAG: GNAT family N-acetyltransferase [Firmicutes bacterium]|nr:GNAT family N-acetyltransferase [Bacillota bacterium]
MGSLAKGEVNSIKSEHKLNAGESVEIEGPVNAEYIRSLKMDDHLNNFRLAARQHEALINITGLDSGYVYIARNQNTVVGYITFHKPDQYGRWYRHPAILELGCVEVSPAWRGHRIGKILLRKAFSQPVLENYIVITTEYYWHWDMESTGMDVWSYQKMLTNLFGSVGFEQRHTDDEEIMEHPANVLMVRVGSEVNKENIVSFEQLLFSSMF